MTTLVARDGFNRANTGDINGSAADGDGDAAVALGTWAQHPAEPFPIGIDASDAVSKNTQYSVYTLGGTGVDPIQHGAETVLNLPAFDTPGFPCPCTPAGEGFYHGPGNPETYLSPDLPNHQMWRLWFERPAAGTVITIEATFPPAIFWKIYYEVQADGTTVKIYEDLTGFPSPSIGPYSHRLIQTFTARAACDFIQFDAGTAGNAIGAAWGGVGGGIGRGSTVPQSGVPTVSYSAPGVTLNTTDPGRTCGSNGNENGYTEVLVRCDPTVEDNYALGAFYTHAMGTPTPIIEFQLWAAVGGSYTQLHTHTANASHDDPQPMRLEVSTDNILSAYWAGALLFTFDLANDLAVETGLLAPMIASGSPGMTFIQPDPTHVRIQQFSVYTGESYPCEGPPDNPYPYLPPPITGPRSFGIWVRKNDAWRQVPIENIHPKARGVFKGIDQLIPPMVRARNAWRVIVEGNDSATIPEPETPLPPFFDPCELLPELPPPTDVPLLPLTDRFFGISNSPTTILGPLFNGCKRTIGPWTPMEINQCAARSSVLMGAQGSYGKFLLNGRFEWEHFVSVTLGMALPVLSAMQAGTAAGSFFGYSFIDDFDSHTLWPPSGVSDADMVRIVNALHSALPGIRIGLRGRPTQFPVDFGLDFYGCQYVSWKHGNARTFAQTEYSIARSRGSYITLDMNYIAGGNGSSGINWFSNPQWYAMSPNEVMEYMDELCDGTQDVDPSASFLAGSLGYQYRPEFLAIPGMLAGLSNARNRLAQLPPP